MARNTQLETLAWNFNLVWIVLSRACLCDDIGSEEYQRVWMGAIEKVKKGGKFLGIEGLTDYIIAEANEVVKVRKRKRPFSRAEKGQEKPSADN